MSSSQSADPQLTSPEERKSGWDALVRQLALTEPSDLSRSALDAAGRLVADCLICAAAGAQFPRSRALRQVLEREGGRAESWTAGGSARLPASRAAMVNAEAMNLLDADDTFLNIAHFGSLIVAVALAQAESLRASWMELRRAVVSGFELNAKLALACEANAGFMAPGMMLPGAIVTAVALAGGTCDELGNALGLGMRFAPGPVTRQVSLGEPNSIKYAPYASMAEQAILAARLAAAGYRSSPDLIVSVPGFAEGQQTRVTRWQHLRPTDPAQGWWVEQTSLKPYPSFRLGHPAIDAVRQIVERQSLSHEAIDAIEIHMDPRALRLPFHHWNFPDPGQSHLLPIAASMNLRLSATLAAMRVPPGPRWLEPARLLAPQTKRLYDRVHLGETAAIDPVTFQMIGRTGGEAFARVIIRAGNARFEAYQESADGDPWHPSTRPDWSWLRIKEQNFLQSDSLVAAVRSLSDDTDMCGFPKDLTGV